MAQLSSQQKPASKTTLKIGLALCLGFGILDLGVLNFWAAPAAFLPSVQAPESGPVAQAGVNSTGEQPASPSSTASPSDPQAGGGTEPGAGAGTGTGEEPGQPQPEQPGEPAAGGAVAKRPGSETPKEPEQGAVPAAPGTKAEEKPVAKPAAPPEPPPRPAIPAKVVVYFETAQYTLSPKARGQLAKLARLLLASPGRRLHITGHADRRGDGEYNLRLSGKRADTVAVFLKNKRVKADFETEGVGDRFPVGTGDSIRELARNRRVEIKISQGDQ